MGNIKIGKITLSFTLISLGLVIFLEKFSPYQWLDLFAILWPTIIIFFGLEVIYAFLSAKKESDEKPRLDKWSLVITCLLVLGIGTSGFLVSEYPHMKNALNKQLSYKYREDILERVTLNQTKKLIIDDINTDIIINRSASQDLEVRLEGIYKHNKKMKNPKLKMLKADNRGKVTRISKSLKSKRENIRKMNMENMRYLVYLPEDTDIEVISKYGDVLVDLKANTSNNVDVRSYYGDVTTILPRNQEGKFNIITTYGSIYDELDFDIIESISSVTIDETRKTAKPSFYIRVNNGNIILKTD